MRKALFALSLIIIMISNLNVQVFAKSDKARLRSDAAVLIDMSNEKFLYSLNTDEKIKPGGFTKIMTAIIALEHIKDVNATVTADVNTLSMYDYSFGHMGILAGEKLTYDNLLHGMLIYDAGDAAEVIASEVLGSRDDFIKEMNNKVVDIGALNTKFTNPTGFPDKNQYSTIEDIYKITKYAMANPVFKAIVGKSRYEMKPTNKYTQYRYLDNKNKFMNVSTTDMYFTSKAKGIKTSYIDDNNSGLILQYESENTKLISIVSGSPYDGTTNFAYDDTSKLLDYGLNYYSSVPVVTEGEIFAEYEITNGKGIDRLLIDAKKDIFVNLPKNYDESKITKEVTLEEKVKAPIKKGQVLGKVTIKYNGEEYYSFNLTSDKNIEANHFKGIFKKIWTFITSPTLLVIMGVLLIIFVWSVFIFNKNKDYKIDKNK